MVKHWSRPMPLVMAVGILILLGGVFTAAARAAPVLPNLMATEPVGMFGNLAQTTRGVNCGNVNCGATALVNSFVYLQNTYRNVYANRLIGNARNAPTTAELVAAANSLSCTFLGNCQPPAIMTGTPIGDFILGKQDYFDTVAPMTTMFEAQITETWGNNIVLFHKGKGVPPKPAFVADNTKPTARFLYDQLNAGEDVEIVVRGPRVNHYLTLTGINFNPNTNRGTITVIDPGTGRPTPQPLTVGLFAMGANNGFLGTNYDMFAGAVILDAVAESPTMRVPEPAALALMMVGLAGLGLTRARARNASPWPWPRALRPRPVRSILACLERGTGKHVGARRSDGRRHLAG